MNLLKNINLNLKKEQKEKLGSVYFNNNDTELSELAEDLNSMKLDLSLFRCEMGPATST